LAEAALPLILAGPIVRRVEPRSCSAWVALRDASGEVRLTVWRGLQTAGAVAGQVASGNAPVGTAVVATRQFARKLHAALVTISLAPPQPPLEPGTIYAYDLQVGDKGLRQLKLLGGPEVAPGLPLGYATDRLPSFVTPPARVEQTCFAHTSCRRSGAPDHDALPAVDDLIGTSLTDPFERPQQLFLTGDQIYADDLPARLLQMLSPIALAVVGPDEMVNGLAVDLDRYPADDVVDPPLEIEASTHILRARGRKRALQQLAGFSTSDDHHLLSFGEYVAMYLAVWNPRIWSLTDTNDTPSPSANGVDGARLRRNA
jgi:hypothetical protein